MINVNVDLMGKDSVQGEVANQIMTNGRLDAGMMRPYIGQDGRSYITIYSGGDPVKADSYKAIPIQTNATLRRDEWISLDEALRPIAESRLTGVQDLIDNDLVYNLGNAMGTTVLEWHDVSDSMEADITMDGVTRSIGGRVNYEANYLPIPIIHSDYEINLRVLEASRRMGNPLDTTAAIRAGRRVMERLENMLFTDTSYTFGGGAIYSYINYPNRNQIAMDVVWDESGGTGEIIVSNVLGMKQASLDAKHFGPWMLYIPSAYETVLDEDYDSTRGTTVRDRILAIAGIKGVKVIDTLPADNVVLVQMSPEVVRLIRGLPLQNVEWQTEGKFITKYKALTIQVPQIRSDQDGNTGIVHLAPA